MQMSTDWVITNCQKSSDISDENLLHFIAYKYFMSDEKFLPLASNDSSYLRLTENNKYNVNQCT